MKTYAKAVLLFILILYGLAGCSYTPHPKGYVCVSKPPIKITYIDYHKDINACVVNAMIDRAVSVPFQNVKLNERNEVAVSYDVEGTHSSSTSNTLTIKGE